MSDTDIHLDPVADGAPRTHDRLELALMVALVAFAAWELSVGAYFEAFNALLFATVFYLYGKMRRRQWLAGYATATETIAEQIDSEVER